MAKGDFITRSAELATLGGVPVDENDLRLLRRWLDVMFKRGTDGIKITVGKEPDTWIVRLLD